MEPGFQLPDGRQPLRFDKGRAAYYMKAHGDGEVRYTFSMIKHFQRHRPLLTDAERSEAARRRAEIYKHKDPDWFRKLGQKGGKAGKRGSQDSQDQEGEGLQAGA